MRTAPFVSDREEFLPTTPLTEEEATRAYKTGKRRLGSFTNSAERFLDATDAGLQKQLETSQKLKTGQEVKQKYGHISPTDLALGGAGPPSKEAVKEAAGYAGTAAKEWFGDTPIDWAANSLMGPGKLPVRIARAAAIGSLHTPEAEGVLLNLDKASMGRFDKTLAQARRLRDQGISGEELFRETGGLMTLGPRRELEGINRPRGNPKLGGISDRTSFIKNIWDDPELFERFPGLGETGIRYGRIGEDFMPRSGTAAFYKQPHPKTGNVGSIIINPESQSVKNAKDFKGLIGHEMGHGLSYEIGDLQRLGANSALKRAELELAGDDLINVVQHIKDPAERARIFRLAHRLKKVDPKDLYYRDLGEAHGRASQAAVMQKHADPYSHHLNATKFGLERPGFESTPYQRLITPSSALESGDMDTVMRKYYHLLPPE